ncbi:hypothetical protein KKF61_08780 [Patescibacteria group bacterium]|nr:hypothetical protein [Patescibacteria group bacterium]
MAQTTAAPSFKDCTVETSPDNSNWTDISGFASTVSVDGGERATGVKYTFDGDTAILRSSKRGPLTVTVNIAYTEGASDPTEVIRAIYEAGSDFYVRWSPKGGQSTEFLYTTAAGVVKSPLYPGGEAESGDPVMVDFVLETPFVTKSAVA